jgi:hypothetical protein
MEGRRSGTAFVLERPCSGTSLFWNVPVLDVPVLDGPALEWPCSLAALLVERRCPRLHDGRLGLLLFFLQDRQKYFHESRIPTLS